MDIKVVDTSALAALIFGEEGAEAVSADLAHGRLVAPPLLRFELANVCWAKIRRHAEQKDMILAAFALRHLLSIETISVDEDAALALALDTGLTVYDASYLWLAHRLGGQVITLDRQLAAAQRAMMLR
jgi:predicted nucleic acid-binding protein